MGRPFIELTGKRFGRWAVLAQRKRLAQSTNSRWLCKCDCGTRKIVYGPQLTGGGSKSCGCFRAEEAAKRALIHGHTTGNNYSKEWSSWHSMRQRCLNPRHPSYRYYGGRGITICARWSNFEKFLADIGNRPSPSHSLDRINNNGNYTPKNCKWSDKKEQGRNRRTCVYLTHKGKTKTIAEWAAILGIDWSSMKHRSIKWGACDRTFSPKRKEKKVHAPIGAILAGIRN